MRTRRLTGDDWRTWRDLRLAALADAPHAYGSTLEAERALDEAEWRRRLDTGLSVIAVRDGECAGMVALYVPDDTPMLVAMWVDPAHRGCGVGDALVTEILRLARERPVHSGEKRWSHVVLRVAEGNEAARKLFLRHGFTATGRHVPLESDPGVRTEILSRPL
ncbi:GNAT family N-acetyltransferase [Actinophytocola sp.]|uniref:GNAT family N-acetyltransferase n=1 Tax=Actinophytocola sp. TaxID=1872138 RepID=UPI00389985FF